jgi:hypothetical protein
MFFQLQSLRTVNPHTLWRHSDWDDFIVCIADAPLHHACRNRHPHIIKALIEAKADIEAKDGYAFQLCHASAFVSFSSAVPMKSRR